MNDPDMPLPRNTLQLILGIPCMKRDLLYSFQQVRVCRGVCSQQDVPGKAQKGKCVS